MPTEPVSAPPGRRSAWFAVGLLAIVQTALLLWLGSVVGTSRDEEYALATTAHGPAYALTRSLGFELQAPLYFVVCALWREIDASMLFARDLSTAFVVATTILVATISIRLRPHRPPVELALGYAICPFVTYAALDIRAYALAMLLLAVATLAFIDGWVCARRVSARVIFVVAAILGVYTQYYVAFFVAGLAIGLVAAGRARALASYVAAASIVAVATLILLHVVPSQFSAYDFVPRPPLAALTNVAGQPIRQFAIPATGLREFGLSRSLYGTLVAVFLVAFLAGGVEWRRPNVRLAAGSLFGMILCYVVSAVVLHVEFTPPRHYLVLVLPLILFGAIVLDSMRGRFRIAASVAIVGIFATSSLTDTLWNYHRGAKFGDWKRVAFFVGTRVRPGDRVAVFEADAVPAFRRWFLPQIPVLPFPHAVDGNRYDADALVVHSEVEARVALRRLTAGRTHVFLAIDCAYVERFPHEGCGYVTEAIDAAFPERGRTDFFEAWVAELPSGRRGSSRRAGVTAAARRTSAQ